MPLDPDCLYGTSPPPSQQHTAEAIAVTAMDTGRDSSVVDESDLGGFSQLAAIEPMLDRGEGLGAGLQGVAMTRRVALLFCDFPIGIGSYDGVDVPIGDSTAYRPSPAVKGCCYLVDLVGGRAIADI